MKLSSCFNQILHGDCIRVMRSLPSESVDLVVTDPPYLVNYKDRNGRSAYPNDTHSRWIEPAFAEIFRLLKKDRLCVSFYGWPRAERFLLAWKAVGFCPVSHLVWVKGYASYRGFAESRHDLAYLLAKGFPARPVKPPPDVLRWDYEGNDLHPAQKPVGALLPLIHAYSSPGEVVLDPFAGSGTTGMAPRACGRKFILIEKVWRYQQIAKARLARNMGKPRLVDGNRRDGGSFRRIPQSNQFHRS